MTVAYEEMLAVDLAGERVEAQCSACRDVHTLAVVVGMKVRQLEPGEVQVSIRSKGQPVAPDTIAILYETAVRCEKCKSKFNGVVLTGHDSTYDVFWLLVRIA